MPAMPMRLDQLVDRAGRDALHVGFLDHRRQRLLGHPPRLQEAREVAALPELGDAQLDRPGPGLPVAIAIAVAMVGSALAALAVAGAAQGVGPPAPSSVARRSRSSRAAMSCRNPSPAAREGRSCRRSSWCSPRSELRLKPNPTEEHRGDHQLWISSPPPPDSRRSLRRATYPQLLHHARGHDPAS